MADKWIVEVNVIDHLGLGLTIGEFNGGRTIGDAMIKVKQIKGMTAKELEDSHIDFESWPEDFDSNGKIIGVNICYYDDDLGTDERTYRYIDF